MKTTSDPKSEVQEVTLKFSNLISNLKSMHLKRSYKKSVIFDIFGVFGLKTTSDHKSEVLKVAFKSDRI